MLPFSEDEDAVKRAFEIDKMVEFSTLIPGMVRELFKEEANTERGKMLALYILGAAHDLHVDATMADELLTKIIIPAIGQPAADRPDTVKRRLWEETWAKSMQFSLGEGNSC